MQLTFKLMYNLNSSIQSQRMCFLSIFEINISFFSPKLFPLLLSFSYCASGMRPTESLPSCGWHYCFCFRVRSNEKLERFRWWHHHCLVEGSFMSPCFQTVGGQELEWRIGAHSITQQHSGVNCRLVDCQPSILTISVTKVYHSPSITCCCCWGVKSVKRKGMFFILSCLLSHSHCWLTAMPHRPNSSHPCCTSLISVLFR